MTGNTGLRRFVAGAAAPPGIPPGPAAGPPSLPGLSAGSAPAQAPVGPPPGGAPPQERCEMCAADIGADHGHVADLDNSSLSCTCRACYLLFTSSQAGGGRYRGVPDRYLTDPARELTPAQWDDFQIPVGLAFFLHSSRSGEVHAFYPSPAGATESTLNLAAWDQLAGAYPLLAAAEADVEAILICRTGAGVEYFLVPVDACYELAGRMRLYWRGFDGGTQAREAIDAFLAQVRSRARAYAGEA
jgi:hypothetical protein